MSVPPTCPRKSPPCSPSPGGLLLRGGQARPRFLALSVRWGGPVLMTTEQDIESMAAAIAEQVDPDRTPIGNSLGRRSPRAAGLLLCLIASAMVGVCLEAAPGTQPAGEEPAQTAPPGGQPPAAPALPAPDPADYLPEVVARVGEWTVTRDVVWPRIRVKVERTLAAGQPVPASLIRFFARPIVSFMVEQRLLAPRAASAGFRPDLERARLHLHRIKARAGAGEDDAVKRFLDGQGMTEEEYVTDVATKTAVKDWVHQEIVLKQPVADDELRALYEQHKQSFRRPARVRLARIMVRPQTDTPEARDEARALVRALRGRLEAGEPFAAVTSGSDPERVRSGELGWQTASRVPPPIRDAVLALEAGQVSAVLERQDGFYIVHCTGRQEERVPGFEETEPKVRDLLMKRKAQERVKELVKELREAAGAVLYPPLEDRQPPAEKPDPPAAN